MKQSRRGIVLLMLTIILALVPAALAQDQTFGLSSDDYALWTAANQGSMSATSLAYDFTLNLKFSGLQNSNITADLKGSGVLSTDTTNPQFQLDVTGSIKQDTQSQDVSLGLRIVNGYIYYNTGEGWNGATLKDELSNLSGMFGAGLATSGLPVNPSDFSSGNLSSLTQNPAAVGAMAALSQLNPSDFVKIVRSDASGLADFNISVDVAKLLASPSLTPLVKSVAAMSGTSDQQETDAQIQQTQQLLAAMVAGIKVNLDQFVDPTSKLVQRDLLDINAPLDNVLGPGAIFTLKADINLSNFNQPVSVEAPAGAQMTPSTSS